MNEEGFFDVSDRPRGLFCHHRVIEGSLNVTPWFVYAYLPMSVPGFPVYLTTRFLDHGLIIGIFTRFIRPWSYKERFFLATV